MKIVVGCSVFLVLRFFFPWRKAARCVTVLSDARGADMSGTVQVYIEHSCHEYLFFTTRPQPNEVIIFKNITVRPLGFEWCPVHRGVRASARLTSWGGKMRLLQFFIIIWWQHLFARCELKIPRVSESNRRHIGRQGCRERTTLGRQYFCPPTL